jgi:hypothetical protein
LRNKLFWRLTQFMSLFYGSWPPAIKGSEPFCPFSQHAGLKYQWGPTSRMMFRASQAIWEIRDRVLVRNIFQKNFIGSDKISEISKDSDSDCGSFSELSDSDTCEVNSPFSSSSEEEKFSSQNLTEAGRKHAGPFINAPI